MDNSTTMKPAADKRTVWLIVVITLVVILLLGLLLLSPVRKTLFGKVITAPDDQPLTLTSNFVNGQIPVAQACTDVGGSNTIPLVTVSNVPAGTQSFALIMDDVSTTPATTHWLVWNIPAALNADGTLNVAGGTSGNNYIPAIGYAGPCPPEGDPAHNYQFRVFAVSSEATLDPLSTTPTDLLAAINAASDTLPFTPLIGTFQVPCTANAQCNYAGSLRPVCDIPSGLCEESMAMSDDADNDGVLDSSDICPNTPVTMAVDSNGCPLPTGQCGDNTVQAAETCDDGNIVTETFCPYGQATCTFCNSDCTTALSLTGQYCGDRNINGPETCDDGNTVNDDGCSSTCTTETVTLFANGATCTSNAQCSSNYCNDAGSRVCAVVSICGNSVVDESEQCDGGTNCNQCQCAPRYHSSIPVSVNCVACNVDADCSTGQTCDTATHSCFVTPMTTGCTTDATCNVPTPYCFTAKNSCVQCTADLHCSSGSVCITQKCTTILSDIQTALNNQASTPAQRLSAIVAHFKNKWNDLFR